MCRILTPPLLERLNWAAAYLKEKGIESFMLDAELLLAHILGTERLNLYIEEANRVLNDHEDDLFRRLYKRRANYEPIAYILGRKEFMSLEFKVTPAVFIPRPETELLVEGVLKVVQNPGLIVDLGTGCGNIAVSLAKLLPDSRIYATDISPEALAVAQENIETFGMSKQITLLEGDLFKALDGLELKGQVDVIISNPPYIPQEEWENLALEVRRFEPRIALDGGREGLEFYKRIIEEAPIFLKNGGILALEMGVGQVEKVRSLSEAKRVYHQLQIIKDYQGIDRVILLKYSP